MEFLGLATGCVSDPKDSMDIQNIVIQNPQFHNLEKHPEVDLQDEIPPKK